MILEEMDCGRPVAVVLSLTESRPPEPDSPAPGDRLLVGPGGAWGTLGSRDVDAAARTLALEAIDAALLEATRGSHREKGGGLAREGAHRLAIPGRKMELEVYLELHLPEPQLLIVGAGHIARPLCTVGSLLDFRVTVLDDRPGFATAERFPEVSRVEKVDFADPFTDIAVGPSSYVILVTRGHRYDFECLRRLLRLEPGPGYIGMIGSRRRVRATYVRLQDEGIPIDRIAEIHAPVGLDLGAETPEEIAVSVAAELVLLRRGGSGRPLKDVEDVARRLLHD